MQAACEHIGLIRGLLPPIIAVAEAPQDGDRAFEPWPAEAVHIAQATPGRRAEFAFGRALAREALAVLGQAAMAIPAGRNRAPLWPPGFTGSIAHCRTHAAAAVGRTGEVAAIGIDLESVARFHHALDGHILTAAERARLDELSATEAQQARAIIFAAKEAFYKCQYMLSRRRLGFDDGVVEIDHAAGAFALTLLTDAPPFIRGQVFPGRFALASGLVGAALWLPLP